MPIEHPPMPLEEERRLYFDGIRFFNEGEFFEAHEVWEDAWHAAYGAKHSFYQGMIQCAVSLEHYRRSNPRGVLSLYRSYPNKFAGLSDPFMGLEVGKFLKCMREVLGPVVQADPLPEKGEIELDLGKTPRIALVYDPFETGEAERYTRPTAF